MKKIAVILLPLFLLFLIFYFCYPTKEPIRIVFASDDNYLPHLATAITSIVENSNKDDKFDFYLLESSVSKENKTKLKSYANHLKVSLNIIHIDDNKLKSVKIENRALTKAAYLRFFISDVFPFDKILYLDGDILVFKSLGEFYREDIRDFYAGVVHDRNPRNDKRFPLKYFNSGVLLLNLKKMRKDSITSDTLFKNMDKLYEEKNLVHEDQDVLNFTFKNNVKFLPLEYNFTGSTWKKHLSQIFILHMAGHVGERKPWKVKDHIYWKYRNKTPWKIDPHSLFSKMCPIPKNYHKKFDREKIFASILTPNKVR